MENLIDMEDKVYGYVIKILEDDLYNYLSNFTDFHMKQRMDFFTEVQDYDALDIALDVMNDRKKMREEIGGKYIEHEGVMHEILWRDENDFFGIVPTTADKELNDYIVYEIMIDGISNTDRKDSESKRAKICDTSSDTEGKEVQGSPRVGRSFNSLWGQFLSSFSWHREGE